MPDKDRKNIDGKDANKKRQRMREDLDARRARAGGAREQRDEVDVVTYKPGSGGDRNMRRGPLPVG